MIFYCPVLDEIATIDGLRLESLFGQPQWTMTTRNESVMNFQLENYDWIFVGYL